MKQNDIIIVNMSVERLREKHPTFTYKSFRIVRTDKNLTVDFNFVLEPGINFCPTVSIPCLEKSEKAEIENLAFHLGLVELISYWKATCSPNIVVEAGQLNNQQIRWWHDLFIHGLGEFFFKNQIDFTKPEFLSINSTGKAPTYKRNERGVLPAGDLVMIGGGKDSIVTLETLKGNAVRKNVFMLNPTTAALNVTKEAGFSNPLIIRRELDPKLLELNKQGYLNGHTPFSAYLAFLGIFVGTLHDYQNIIASNEQSAGEGNILFHGLEANHQYSKSLRFEKMFRDYCAKYLSSDVQYFSFLRPLYELQIAKLFKSHSDQYSSFCSCNANRGESWCGACAKCAFVYLSLFPFLETEKIEKIFGKDFFTAPVIQKHIIDLVGLGEHKPFDCVGTVEESKIAVGLVIKKYQRENQPIPEFFAYLSDRLGLLEEQIYNLFEQRLRKDWNEEHFLPDKYAKLLKDKLKKI